MNWIKIEVSKPACDHNGPILVTNGTNTWHAKYWSQNDSWTSWDGEPGYTITHWIYFKDIPKP